MKSFAGTIALVSGASSGIGEAAAVALAEAGAVVHGLASSAATLEAAAARHPHIRWLAADLTKRADAAAAVDAVLAGGGRLDVLVNNAGIYRFAPLEASSEDLVRSQFEINVFGLIHLTQAALPALKSSAGTIVNVSSTSAHKAMPGQSVYGATKAAVESLTRSWALELAPHRVRVNAVSPGPTETPGIANLPLPKEVFEAMKAQVLKSVPLGRMASSAEIAHWIVRLADPRVTWLTGQILGIDGGLGIA